MPKEQKKINIVEADVSNDQEKIVRVANIDSLGRSYATGKRKNSIARVWIKKGTGNVLVNCKEAGAYLQRDILLRIISQPFAVTNTENKFDVICTVKGGGLSGQAGAIRHGIAIALQNFDPSNRDALKLEGLLTRDPRVVERKKAGLRGARKGRVYRRR